MISTTSLEFIPYEHFWKLKLSKNLRVNFTALLNVMLAIHIFRFS